MSGIAQQPKILVGVIDHLPAEAQAMIIAKYSRTYDTVENWIPDTEEGIDSLMKRMGITFLGYGHKSVGQLGHTTIFLEGVSQLAAKAIEDSQLFNGQESSTRYIDYSTQPMVVVQNHPEWDKVINSYQEKFRALYIKAMPLVRERLEKEYPQEVSLIEEQKKFEEEGKEFTEKDLKAFQTKWTNTIKARTFDICRGLLPAGSVTNVAFTGTFDLINDHFGAMLYHPSKEMRDIAERVLRMTKERYEHGTETVGKLRERFEYIDRHGAMSYFYHDVPELPWFSVVMDGEMPTELPKCITRRRKYDQVPRHVSENFRFRLGGKLDFGAFRDLHRHRNGVILMPLLTAEHGFHSWYLMELPTDIAKEAVQLLGELENAIPAIFQMQVHLQYAIPMGARVRIKYDCGFNQLAYIQELRSGKTVHQTLRMWTHDVYGMMEHSGRYADMAEHIFPDLDKNNFTLKRGTQTFTTT